VAFPCGFCAWGLWPPILRTPPGRLYRGWVGLWAVLVRRSGRVGLGQDSAGLTSEHSQNRSCDFSVIWFHSGAFGAVLFQNLKGDASYPSGKSH
jgi:hypothetical protein